MCTMWTIGHWASFLFACKLLSDEQPGTFHPSVTRATKASRISQAKEDETRIYVIKPKTPSKCKSNKRRLVPVSTPSAKDYERPNNNKVCPQYYRPEFIEEDFIDFCFRKDGTFDIVKYEKPESAHHVKYKTEPSRAIINQKTQLVYGEDTDTDTDTDSYTYSKYEDEDVSSEDGIDSDVTNEQEAEDEEKSIYFDSEAPLPRIIREEAHDADNSGSHSQESRFSTSTQTLRSSSAGSFAFPVLPCEWNSSPIRMPEPEGLHLRKLKPLRMIGLQCCKF